MSTIVWAMGFSRKKLLSHTLWKVQYPQSKTPLESPNLQDLIVDSGNLLSSTTGETVLIESPNKGKELEKSWNKCWKKGFDSRTKWKNCLTAFHYFLVIKGHYFSLKGHYFSLKGQFVLTSMMNYCCEVTNPLFP